MATTAQPKLTLTAEDKTAAAFQSVMANLSKAQASTTGLVGALTGVAPALAAALSVTGLAAFVRGTVNAVDALNDVKDATGASIENISALESIALRTGASLEDVSSVLIKFNAALKEADGKNAISQALKSIGLDAEQLRRMDPAEALQKTAIAFAQFSDDGNKARIMQELFGKAVGRAAPLLNDIAEAGRLNATTTTAQAQAAEAFNKQLFQLSANFSLAARGLTADLLPMLLKYSEVLSRLPKNLDIKYAEGGAMVAAQQLQRSTSMLEQLQAALKADPGNRALESRIKDLRAEVDTLSKSASSAATGLHNLVGQQLDLGQTDPRELARRGRGGAAFGQASLPDLFGKGASGTAPKSAQPDLTIPQQLQDALKALDGTDVEKISRLRAELLQLVSLKSSGSQDARLDEAIATATAELEKLNPATQQAIAQQKQLVDLLAATPSAQLQATQADMQLLAAALERGAISAAQFEEAVNVRLGNTAPAIEKTKSLADELGLSFSSAFEDAVAKGDSFGGMLKAIEQDLIRIAARKFVTEPALNYLGSLFSGGGSGGSWLTTITALFGGGKAVGGSVDAGKFYRVNESGSELLTMGGKDYLMMGSRSGRITPNSKLGGGGSAMHFDFSGQTIQVGAGVSMAQVASAVKAGNQATESHIRRLMREGAMA